MSIKGSSVHKSIKTKIREAEAESKVLVNRVYSIENDLADLGVKREDQYIVLAYHYLPELDADSVKDTLREVRTEVERVFREKGERRRTLEGLMEENRKKNHELEEKVENVILIIDEKTNERDELLKTISADLQKISEYIALDQEAKKAEARLQQNKQRVEEVEKESMEKLPAFEQNKLFRYLLKVGYGAGDYNSNRLKRRLDSWVAQKVNFAENKECYDFLKSMPEMMGLEVERRQSELDKIIAGMEEIESTVEERYGLPDVVNTINQLDSKREGLISADKKQDEQYADYVKERAKIDGNKDPYHLEAIKRIKDYLKSQKITDLKSRARSTHGVQDDKIADDIDTIDKRVRKLKDEAIRVKTDRDELETKLEGLRNAEERFKQKRYDSTYSTFSRDFDINDMLTGYMLGRMSSSDLNRGIDNYQHTATPTYHSSGSYRGSSHSSSTTFSSFSSIGSVGGGSFSTSAGIY